MSNVEVRRIQRVGSSSLVVTLPKPWAKRLGLQPGSSVLLVDEGDSIRVIPVDKRGSRPLAIDLSRAPEWLAGATPLCVYLSGFSEAEVLLPKGVGGELLRARSLDLMALHVYEQAPGEARIEVLLDSERIDLPRLLKSLAGVARRAAMLVLEALRGSPGVEGEIEIAKREFLRVHYVVLRYLASNSVQEGVSGYHAALSASYSGFAVDLLLETAAYAARRSGETTPEVLVQAVEETADIVDLLFRILARPSVKRLAELYSRLSQTRELLGGEMEKLPGLHAVVAAKLHDVLRLVTIAAYVATCRVIVEGVQS